MTNESNPPVAEILASADISYRQLDYWVRQGYLQPIDAEPGSGLRRTWPDAELRVAAWMRRLIAAGFTVEAAAGHARTVVEFEDSVPGPVDGALPVFEHLIGDGLMLRVVSF